MRSSGLSSAAGLVEDSQELLLLVSVPSENKPLVTGGSLNIQTRAVGGVGSASEPPGLVTTV